MTTYETVIVGRRGHGRRRWALVTNYANLGGGYGRQGWWCEDAAGGWGTSRRSADEAVAHCIRPVLYATRQEALDTVGEHPTDALRWGTQLFGKAAK